MTRKTLAPILLLLLLSGCFSIDHQVAPEKAYTISGMENAGLEKIAHREATRYGFRLLFIPISMPKTIDMVDAMIVKERAVGVTNLTVETSEFNVLLFQIPKVKVGADLVGKKK